MRRWQLPGRAFELPAVQEQLPSVAACMTASLAAHMMTALQTDRTLSSPALVASYTLPLVLLLQPLPGLSLLCLGVWET